MKWGLRLQLVLLLGALLLLFYVPLFFATSTYTRVGLEQLQRHNAAKLGRAVAAHLAAQRQDIDDEAFLDLARSQIRRESVHALSLVRPDRPPLAVLGEADLIQTIAREANFSNEAEVRQLVTPKGPAILVFEPDPKGGVAAIVRVDQEITRADDLAQLMGLYMAVGGIALLAAAYFALTRWIVRPILALEREAGRTKSGGRLRQLEHAPRELMSLSRNLADMTERLRDDEEALRKKIDELEARTNELREAQASLVRSERLATVGRLAAGLAHEVGNPISALIGLQDLMMTGELSPAEQKDFLERMRKETARIDRVLTDLLAYARPGGGNKRANGANPSGIVPEAIADVLALLAPQGGFRDVRLETRIVEPLPKVPMSQEELTQILLNLVMNAADACNKNGRVVIGTQSRDGKVRLSVEDDGPGIPEQVKDNLFEPFVTTKEVGQGTGLGLAVTRGLVEAAGGHVFVEASALGGARFVIDFPPLETPSA